MSKHTIEKDIYRFFNRDLKLRTPLEKYPGKPPPRVYATGEIRLNPPPPPDFEILKFWPTYEKS